MISFMNDLLDMVGDRETHPPMGLLDVVTLPSRCFGIAMKRKFAAIAMRSPGYMSSRQKFPWMSAGVQRNGERSGIRVFVASQDFVGRPLAAVHRGTD